LGTQLLAFDAFSGSDICIHFQNTNGFALRITIKSPQACDHHLIAIASAMRQFSFPTTVFLQSLFDFRQRHGETGLQ
jgi:hypothetical protein